MSSPCAAAGNTAHLGSWYIVSTHLSDAKHQNLARRCLHEIFTELASIHSESFLLRCSRRLYESPLCLPFHHAPIGAQDGLHFEGLEPSLKIILKIFIYPILLLLKPS